MFTTEQDEINGDFLEQVSNIPAELLFNLESIKELESYIKRIIDSSRWNIEKYLEHTKDSKIFSSDTDLESPLKDLHSHFSEEAINSLRQKLGSKKRLNYLLETTNSEARIYLFNYYKDYASALEKLETEISQVQGALDSLNKGYSKLVSIFPNMEKEIDLAEIKTRKVEGQSRCEPYNCYYMSQVPQYSSLRGNNLKTRSAYRKDAPSNKDETLYCICRQVSYGDMVGCDNENCPIEWFHYKCVGLTFSPRGAWYCDQCLSKMNQSQESV